MFHHRFVGRYAHEKNARAIAETEIFMFKCLEKGLSAKPIEGSILALRPALIITRDEMDRAIFIIYEAVGKVERERKY
jgi:4-aminobutyrate aminotransferase